jgi:chromosome segregation protein
MLKSLEVHGFKSFADRTVFAFAPGTTCVVGPNGSGKSNVVDAMKWLLGDQSPKSLRGKNMSDVIFNGSSSRKPSAYAEATLTFGNATRALQIDLDEVRITRRLYQGGDSEYLINNEAARLKDIRELFMGTGAGSSAYSIIEQGRVGQVLQGNPSTRRLLFDEAAGISRFKARRIDAERKLERVSQNLLRLTDIVDEVETQLNSCRNQAGKAAKYRELTRAYDALWLGLAADEGRRLHTDCSRLRQQTETASTKVLEVREEQQTAESHREQLRRAFTLADEELRRIEGNLSSLMQQRSSLLTSLHHQTDRAKEIEAEIETMRKQRVTLARRAHDIEREIAAVNQQCAEARQAVETKQSERQSDEAQMQEILSRLETLGQQRTEISQQEQQVSRQQAAAEKHLSHLQARRETVRQAWDRVHTEIAAVEERIAERKVVVDQAEGVYQQALQDNQKHREQIEDIANRRAKIRQEVDTIHARLRQDREQRSAWEARLGLLEDMEKRQLGLSLGVREILERARRSRLAPWKHVLGILPDFLDCDLEHAALVEIALGGGSHVVVVDQLAPLLEYLDRGKTQFEGRVAFVEIPSGKAAMREESEAEAQLAAALAEVPGVLERADRLVRCEPPFRPLMERLLADTWVVDRLTTARQLAWKFPGSLRFLTLQGDLLDSGGTVQTGTLMPEGSVVSRRSEIRRIKNELLQLDRHIQRLTEKTAEMDHILARLDEELKNARAWMESQSLELAEHRQQWHTTAADHKQALRDKEGFEQDREQLRTQQTDVEREIEQEHTHIAELKAELEQHKQQAELLDTETQQAQQRRQELLQGRSQFQLELAKVEERLKAANAVLERLHKDRHSREEQYKEADSRLEKSLEKRARLELQTLNARSRLAELYLIGEQLQVDVRQARARRGETQTERDRLNDQIKQLAETRRIHEEELQDLRIELRDQENELQSLAEKIFEEHQYTLADLIRGGLSALSPFLALRQGDEIEAIEYPPRSWSATHQPTQTQAEMDSAGETSLEHSADDAENSSETVAADAAAPGIELDLQQLLDFTGIEQHPWAWQDSEYDYQEARDQIDREIQRLRKKIKALGAVDPESLKGLDELEFRYKHLSTQLQDLQHAQATLQDIIRKINGESRRIFVESFNTIRIHFQDLFRQLFGGGEGDIVMEDESDPLECGIEIVARPPGKELRSISLMSGGEKTMTAVGLLLAIFRSRPSPFCILDEVDAALDEANIDRFANVLRQFADKTQFIIITHRKRTMTAADRIFGVTMEEAGVSKRLTVRFEDVGENGEINTSGQAAA